jgi:hypothetical protein
MNKVKTEISSFEDAYDYLARWLTDNERTDLTWDILSRLFPVVLSSLVTIFSVLTSSIYFDFIHIVQVIALVTLIFIITFSMLTVPIMISYNMSELTGLKVSKVLIKGEDTDQRIMLDFSPDRKTNLFKGLKKTFEGLTSTAFVILFPAGIVDIVLGYAPYDPKIGIDTTWEIITGLVFIGISVILLSLSIKQEKTNIKKEKDVKTGQMKKLITKIMEKLRTENHASLILDGSGQWSLSSP